MNVVVNDVEFMSVEDGCFSINGVLDGLVENADAIYDLFKNEARLIRFAELQNEEEINEINESLAKIEAGLAIYKNTLAEHIEWLKSDTGEIPFKTKAEQSDKLNEKWSM